MTQQTSIYVRCRKMLVVLWPEDPNAMRAAVAHALGHRDFIPHVAWNASNHDRRQEQLHRAAHWYAEKRGELLKIRAHGIANVALERSASAATADLLEAAAMINEAS